MLNFALFLLSVFVCLCAMLLVVCWLIWQTACEMYEEFNAWLKLKQESEPGRWEPRGGGR